MLKDSDSEARILNCEILYSTRHKKDRSSFLTEDAFLRSGWHDFALMRMCFNQFIVQAQEVAEAALHGELRFLECWNASLRIRCEQNKLLGFKAKFFRLFASLLLLQPQRQPPLRRPTKRRSETFSRPAKTGSRTN